MTTLEVEIKRASRKGLDKLMNNRSIACYLGEVRDAQSATFEVDIKNYHGLPHNTSGGPVKGGALERKHDVLIVKNRRQRTMFLSFSIF